MSYNTKYSVTYDIENLTDEIDLSKITWSLNKTMTKIYNYIKNQINLTISELMEYSNKL